MAAVLRLISAAPNEPFEHHCMPPTYHTPTTHTMERVHLPTVYATGEFADCTVISASGEEFPAHRLVLAQFPRLKELVAVDRRVQLPESTEVVERVLRYMYEADLAPTPDDVQPTRKAVGRELMDVMGLVEAARKVSTVLLQDSVGDDADAT